MAEKTPQAELITEHANIYAALSAFQGELKPIATVEANLGTYKVNYSPLGKIMEVIHPILSKHGLSVRHEMNKDGIECILTHTTTKVTENGAKPIVIGDTLHHVEHFTTVENELRSGIIPVPRTEKMQTLGGAITYAKRYTLSMLLGISSEEDKDVTFEEQTRVNAEKTAYALMKDKIEQGSGEEVKKRIAILKKELNAIAAKKAPSLGLNKEQYDDLLRIADARLVALTVKQDIIDASDEN